MQSSHRGPWYPSTSRGIVMLSTFLDDCSIVYCSCEGDHSPFDVERAIPISQASDLLLFLKAPARCTLSPSSIKGSSPISPEMAPQAALSCIATMNEKGPCRTFPYQSTQASRMPIKAQISQFWTTGCQNDRLPPVFSV